MSELARISAPAVTALTIQATKSGEAIQVHRITAVPEECGSAV
ncbi:hypothetical protein AA0111_g8132 [Alternaria arborescens]|nr:hypothetical protein AA0111_g8132 [Alternaria arborescens]RYO26368.1 hypothetical protein AA0111_g8132 [Alternaria arborescens]